MEWTVVSVIIALVGLFAAVGAPIIRQTRTMTKLDSTMENLSSKLVQLESKNSDAHARIWTHNEKQDEQIHNHEIRIVKLEEHKDAPFKKEK